MKKIRIHTEDTRNVQMLWRIMEQLRDANQLEDALPGGGVVQLARGVVRHAHGPPLRDTLLSNIVVALFHDRKHGAHRGRP